MESKKSYKKGIIVGIAVILVITSIVLLKYSFKNEYIDSQKITKRDMIKEEINKKDFKNKEYILSILEEEKENSEFINEIDNYLNSYLKTENQENEIIYKYAQYCHYNNKIENAIEALEKLGEYRDSQELINEWKGIPPFIGTWSNRKVKIVINSSELYRAITYANGETSVDTYKIYCENDILHAYDNDINNSDFSYKINNEGKLTTVDDTVSYIKLSSDTTKPQANYKLEPKIGMTKSEVENSTWGRPQKVNKTTTKYGTHEQWVYSGNRYLYFDDGELTSIQE